MDDKIKMMLPDEDRTCKNSTEATCYVEVGLLVAEPFEETYPRFFKLKDHFGAVSLKVDMEENGCKDVEILSVYIKKST